MTQETGLEALRAAVDQGRDLYHKNKDGQGFLKQQPEREAPLSEYDRLLNGLYLCASIFGEREALLSFAMVLESNGCEAAAHQVREGIRDAGKEKPTAVEPLFLSSSDATAWAAAAFRYSWSNYWPGQEQGKTEAEWKILHEQVWTANTPPPDNTPSGGFTEEEIAAVTAWCADLDIPISEIAQRPFAGIGIMPNGQRLSKEITPERCRAIAEHLARGE